MCSSDLTADIGSEYPGDGYVRVWMDAEQGGMAERVPLGTYIMAESNGAPDAGCSEADLRSVLHPASEKTVPTGTTYRQGTDGAAAAARLIAGSCACPVSVTGSDPLRSDVVSEDGESALELAWALLSSCQITTDGMGRVTVGPTDMEPAVIAASHIVGSVSTSVSDGTRQLDYTRELVGARVGATVSIDGHLYRVTQQSAECGCGVTVDETAVML